MAERRAILPFDDLPGSTSRLPRLTTGAGGVRAAELLVLAGAGAAAALLTTMLKLNLGIPGSSIIFAVFPLALGLALVPRRGAGTVMAGGAAATTAALGLAGVHLPGVGALTSLLLTGPLLDVALRGGRTGWRLYGAFIVAGAASNAAAFLVRGAAKALAIPGAGGGRRLEAWWPQAIVTYALAGVAAGVISAIAWFHHRRRDGAAAR